MASVCEMDQITGNQETIGTASITVNNTAEEENTAQNDEIGAQSSSGSHKVSIPHHLQLKPPVVRFSSTKGDNSEQVEVIEYTDTDLMDSSSGAGICGATKGPHITLMTLILWPVAIFPSLAVAFYYGAWTWYNLYIYFSEERTICHKIFICPILIITFPLTVGLSSVGIAIFAAFVQISWSFYSWKMEFLDFEKGFYGWLCIKLDLSMCSPYDIYTDELELQPMKT